VKKKRVLSEKTRLVGRRTQDGGEGTRKIGMEEKRKIGARRVDRAGGTTERKEEGK